MSKTARFQSYQFKLLNSAWATVDIPCELIINKMKHVIPLDYSNHGTGILSEIKRALLRGGSLAYEMLIDVLREPGAGIAPYPKLAQRLSSHNIPQLYRYVWVARKDYSVLAQGCSWFSDREGSLAKGRASQPHLVESAERQDYVATLSPRAMFSGAQDLLREN